MPRIIHQSWKSASIPGIYGTLRKTWLAQYSKWTPVLWTDEDNAQLVKTLYPEYLNIFQAFPAEIHRADLARCLYMHTLSHEVSYSVHQNNENNSIPNAFLACTPRYSFWLEYIAEIELAWEANGMTVTGNPARDQVEYISGPVVLRRAYQAWYQPDKEAVSSDYGIVILPPELIYPFAWYATGEGIAESRLETFGDCSMFDLEAARKKFDDGTAYMCTYWGESWREHGWKPQRESAKRL